VLQANNPFVVRFYYSFSSPEKLFLVMEYCQGGDLASMLQVRINSMSNMRLQSDAQVQEASTGVVSTTARSSSSRGSTQEWCAGFVTALLTVLAVRASLWAVAAPSCTPVLQWMHLQRSHDVPLYCSSSMPAAAAAGVLPV
jgi:serine/threonine protein kinase